MGFDAYKKTRCESPFKCIEDQIREKIKGRIVRNKAGAGYTLYVNQKTNGNTFASIQPGIWVYFNPANRQGINGNTPPIIKNTEDIVSVPSSENYHESFGHRFKTDKFDCSELPESVLSAIELGYKQVKRSNWHS